jgi:hypothetical protein
MLAVQVEMVLKLIMCRQKLLGILVLEVAAAE